MLLALQYFCVFLIVDFCNKNIRIKHELLRIRKLILECHQGICFFTMIALSPSKVIDQLANHGDCQYKDQGS